MAPLQPVHIHVETLQPPTDSRVTNNHLKSFILKWSYLPQLAVISEDWHKYTFWGHLYYLAQTVVYGKRKGDFVMFGNNSMNGSQARALS